MSFWKSPRPAHFTRISHDGDRRQNPAVVICLASMKGGAASAATYLNPSANYDR
jgi:hypothetical protein